MDIKAIVTLVGIFGLIAIAIVSLVMDKDGILLGAIIGAILTLVASVTGITIAQKKELITAIKTIMEAYIPKKQDDET